MDKRLTGINKKYLSYHPRPRFELVEKAYNLAQLAYYGEKRLNKEDWIEHSLRIAEYLTDLGVDTITISAGLLHDVMSFGVTKEEIASEVDEDVAELVDKVTNLKEIKGKGIRFASGGAQEEYLRRLILAAAKDMRAVIIRLAEKLDSIETIDCLPKERRKIALKSALNLYAPLAEQIGLSKVKSEIQEKAFAKLKPVRYSSLKKILDTHPLSDERTVEDLILVIKDLLFTEKVVVKEVLGRRKQVYSLHDKAKRYSTQFRIEESKAIEIIRDKVAFRVILHNIEDCYRALDVIHTHFNHIPEELDDYISKPRPNGYQSLQTSVELLPGHYGEIQIRTTEMHEHAEFGPASHILYKLNKSSSKMAPKEKIKMLQHLLSWKTDILEKDKKGVDIQNIENYIFVFTPKGDLIELPRESSVLDFAYNLHTVIGNKAVRAKVNGHLKPLSHKLENGDVIEIVCDSRKKGPNRSHLDFVKSKVARLHIKKHLRGSS